MTERSDVSIEVGPMWMKLENASKLLALTLLLSGSAGCYFFDFFKTSTLTGSGAAVDLAPVLGRSLGSRAGGVDEAALAALYEVKSDHPPAAIRPDPDLYARRLLLQYRDEGSTVARQIGSIESYRGLLGGASDDFLKKPQEEYDATSLLATYKVAASVCTGLVDPGESTHPGWDSILPARPSSWEENLKFLAQRFLGRPSEKIDSAVIDALKSILDQGKVNGAYTNKSYISVCAMLSLDAESLFL
jgi:hypothetical protein